MVDQNQLQQALRSQTREQWKAMAEASGWSAQLQENKCVEIAMKSLFIF